MKEGTCRDHFNAEETILLEMTLEGIPEQPVGLDVIQHSGFQSEDFKLSKDNKALIEEGSGR